MYVHIELLKAVLYTVVAKIIRRLVFSLAKYGFKSVIYFAAVCQ